MSGVDKRVETVREALLYWKVGRLCYTPKYEDALNSLAAAVADAEQERDKEGMRACDEAMARAKAEQRAEEFETALKTSRPVMEILAQEMVLHLEEIDTALTSAEQRADDAEKALRQVRDWIRGGVGTESEAAEAMDAVLEASASPEGAET